MSHMSPSRRYVLRYVFWGWDRARFRQIGIVWHKCNIIGIKCDDERKVCFVSKCSYALRYFFISRNTQRIGTWILWCAITKTVFCSFNSILLPRSPLIYYGACLNMHFVLLQVEDSVRFHRALSRRSGCVRRWMLEVSQTFRAWKYYRLRMWCVRKMCRFWISSSLSIRWVVFRYIACLTESILLFSNILSKYLVWYIFGQKFLNIKFNVLYFAVVRSNIVMNSCWNSVTATSKVK